MLTLLIIQTVHQHGLRREPAFPQGNLRVVGPAEHSFRKVAHQRIRHAHRARVRGIHEIENITYGIACQKPPFHPLSIRELHRYLARTLGAHHRLGFHGSRLLQTPKFDDSFLFLFAPRRKRQSLSFLRENSCAQFSCFPFFVRLRCSRGFPSRIRFKRFRKRRILFVPQRPRVHHVNPGAPRVCQRRGVRLRRRVQHVHQVLRGRLSFPGHHQACSAVHALQKRDVRERVRAHRGGERARVPASDVARPAHELRVDVVRKVRMRQDVPAKNVGTRTAVPRVQVHEQELELRLRQSQGFAVSGFQKRGAGAGAGAIGADEILARHRVELPSELKRGDDRVVHVAVAGVRQRPKTCGERGGKHSREHAGHHARG
mmetsp:Transcript_4621/g.15378  ORF Transcript_4621/g.15378 Transcript_4621/m.15378 type:complete len:373 (+) Transcript_4621:857-1975(+)